MVPDAARPALVSPARRPPGFVGPVGRPPGFVGPVGRPPGFVGPVGRPPGFVGPVGRPGIVDPGAEPLTPGTPTRSLRADIATHRPSYFFLPFLECPPLALPFFL
jgi:hypothetical protein